MGVLSCLNEVFEPNLTVNVLTAGKAAIIYEKDKMHLQISILVVHYWTLMTVKVIPGRLTLIEGFLSRLVCNRQSGRSERVIGMDDARTEK